ncbi:MAG: bifunctional 5,10-methylenetetrahydrofolate dehydrogenase/5,10-methenyltetrahydrofolate cyclohydrolase [Candidatus Doudnabacteria bacterium]|nr:bifunctional 5,10-methylenetetrahydrofolate dehydrogenase/5,10-methenyltetrahydrofolate cyclohydrolase [Candidatus Doudnabacteria bacterium]
MVQIVDGNKIADKILADLAGRIAKFHQAGFSPKLTAIQVGSDPASSSYIKIKQKKAAAIGLRVEAVNYPANISQPELQNAISNLSEDKEVCGILVQLPLPNHLDGQKVLDTIPPELDIDCLTSVNKQKIINSEEFLFSPPAATAVLAILDYYHIDLPKENILIVGSGDLIGKPLAAILLKQNINFEVANRGTKNFEELVGKATLIITGAGSPGLITGEMIRKNAILIDAGTTGSETGAIVGDVDAETVKEKARLLAPVPGGVGPVTIAMLFRNVVASASRIFDTGKPR